MDGTAFIADNTGGGDDFRFKLPYDVSMAGIYATGTSSLTIKVYDASLTLLETSTVNVSSTFAGWSTNFFGIATSGIRYIDFTTTGTYWIADRLTYTAQAAPVPAPGALALLGLDLLGLGNLRRKQKAA